MNLGIGSSEFYKTTRNKKTNRNRLFFLLNDNLGDKENYGEQKYQ